MAKEYCELCKGDYEAEQIRGVKLCATCANGYRLLGKKEYGAIERYKNADYFPMATENAKRLFVEKAQELYKSMVVEDEQNIEFTGDFYEYDVVTIINVNGGQVDKERMMRVLATHAQQGWRLHTMYSNELGKNAIMVMGLGVNATASEDVLIFERKKC